MSTRGSILVATLCLLIVACAQAIEHPEGNFTVDTITFARDVVQQNKYTTILGIEPISSKEVIKRNSVATIFAATFVAKGSQYPQIKNRIDSYCQQLGGAPRFMACHDTEDDKRIYFIYELSRNTYKHQYDWNLVDFRIAQPIAIGSPDFLSYARTQGYATQADLIEIRKHEEVQLKNNEIALAAEGRPVCGAAVFLGWSTGKIIDERVQVRSENGSIQYFPVPYVYICERR